MRDDHTKQLDLETQYRDMASDAIRESEAEEWIEGLVADAPAASAQVKAQVFHNPQ